MGQVGDPRVASAIEEQIRAAFHEHGWRVFVPEQFASLADSETALAALLRLAADEKLDGEVDFVCPEGHRVTTVTLAEWDPRGCRRDACRECEYPDRDEEPRAFARFSIADWWAKTIGGDQKKTPPSGSLPSPH